MKVIEDRPERLTMERRPWILGLAIVAFTMVFVTVGLVMLLDGDLSGLIFALGGGGMGVVGIWAFVRRTRIIFDTATGTVTIRRRSLTGFTEEVLPLDQVDRASVQTSRGDKTDTHRPVLVMKEGAAEPYVPIVPVYASGRGAGRAAKVINTWLGSTGDWH